MCVSVEADPELNPEVPDPGLTAGQLCCERYLDKRTKARTVEGKSKVTQLIGSRSRLNPQVYFLLYSQPAQIMLSNLDMGEKAHSSMGQELGSWEPMASWPPMFIAGGLCLDLLYAQA